MLGQNFFRKEWVLKLLSAGFAVLLWFFVVGEEKAEVSISIPLEIVNLPPDLVIANDVSPAIDIRVYGPRSMIREVSSQRLSRVIDLREATAGHIIENITPDTLPLPGGVRALRIQPNQVEIVLEQLLSKDVPIEPAFTGEPAAYYEIGSSEIKPPRIVLSGPYSEINAIQFIKTLPVDLRGASENFTRQVGLDLRGLHVTPDGPGTVQVMVQIIPARGARRISNVPVRLETGKSGVTWWPKAVSVKIEGPVAKLRQIQKTDIDVRIPAKGLTPGIHEVEPECTVPEGLMLREIVPAKIKITIPENLNSSRG